MSPEESAAVGAEDELAPRQLTEAQELRALTHPVRLALLEVLSLEGPLTATEAGERIGESPTTCSFHLRQLAKYGFVEEAGGGGGRRRPWKLTRRGLSFSGEGDAEQSIAAKELSNLLMQRWLVRHDAWQAVAHLEPEWLPVTGATEHTVFLTLEETTVLQAEIAGLFRRFAGRLSDPSGRPPGARPVEAVLLLHPLLERAPRS